MDESNGRPRLVEAREPEARPLTALSNAMVALHRDHFGRGPRAAKTYITGDLIVCILTDVFTQVEKTLVRAGQVDHVRQTRTLHQQALEEEFKKPVEELTGRKVMAFLSVVHFDPDVAAEVFILAPEGSSDSSQDGAGA